jgi:hypothetical protein
MVLPNRVLQHVCRCYDHFIYKNKSNTYCEHFDELNTIHPKLKFSMGKGTKNNIKHIYLTITRKETKKDS